MVWKEAVAGAGGISCCLARRAGKNRETSSNPEPPEYKSASIPLQWLPAVFRPQVSYKRWHCKGCRQLHRFGSTPWHAPSPTDLNLKTVELSPQTDTPVVTKDIGTFCCGNNLSAATSFYTSILAYSVSDLAEINACSLRVFHNYITCISLTDSILHFF